MSFYITIFPILFIFATHQVRGEVYVTDEDFDVTIKSFRSIPAKFGQSLPEDGLSGRAVKAHPENGCLYIDPPPFDRHATDAASRRWIAVISRGGGCNFETKVKHATDANWTAAIIYNKKGQNQLVPMAGSDDDVIPSVFIGYDDAQVLINRYSYEPAGQPEFRIVLTDDHPFDINQYLLPFAIVVGICFVIMLVIVIYKCVQDYRRHRRHRLPKSALKKLPIHKFKDGDPFETCVICLDDFQEGDKLRVLPCDHGYHAKCIDPWLVKTKRICPQCRKKVFESNDRGAGLISASDRNSDSDSDAEAPPQSQITSASNSVSNSVNDNRDESSSTAPLLGRPRRQYRFFRRGPSGTRTGQRSRRAAGGGTFTSQSSVHAPPRNANSGSDDQQRAGPSGTNRSNLSAVEKLQRAFARESRQQNPERDPRYRHFQNNSSSDNDYQSENLSNDSSDDENTSSLFHQQSRTTQESSSASACPENRVSHGDYNRPSGSKSRNSARNVSAEVHVVPLDDSNVEIVEEQSTRVNDSSASGDSSRSQVNELSDNQEKSQLSHIVEIHADEEVQSSDPDEGNA